MTRSIALMTALALAAVVGVQDLAPSWAGFHTWQYAGVVVILMIVVGSYTGSASKGRDGELGYRLLLVTGGALLIGLAGLASGLLGADTVTISRAPGTVVPLPDLRAAAFFPNADAQSITQGDATILLRHRDGSSVAVPGHGRIFSGSYAVEARPHVAAFIEARDAHGDHLTVTQPTGAAFLSPVLLFPTTVQIEGQSLPADTFATPAIGRKIQAMYFSPAAAASTRVHQMVGDRPAILFAVDDESGHLVSGGLGLAADGSETLVGGVRVRPSIGSYPALVVSSVPAPPALLVGVAAMGCGLLWAFAWPVRRTRMLSGLQPVDPAGTQPG
ncbi:MAG TPA: hypothetical protein VME66_00595 [Candidatus Acidoferrales bacterium]|nr:hypothetical protein [Candidatus Acidoferrales bacterium]